MQRGSTYQAIASEIQSWQELSEAELLSKIGQPAVARFVELNGQTVQIELSAHWQNLALSQVRIQAIAYGPSNWKTERVEEISIVSFRNNESNKVCPPKSDA